MRSPIRHQRFVTVLAVVMVSWFAACGSAASTPGSGASSSTSSMPSMTAGGTSDPTAVFPSAPPVASTHVTIQNFAFNPSVITVRTGVTVTWTNQDEEPHTVVFVGTPAAKSAPLQMGDSFSYTFATPGSFAYLCSIHPQMHGGVVVTSA